MRVKTPAIKLEVGLETVKVDDGFLLFEGVAGMMPCETRIAPAEVWSLFVKCMKPGILWFLLKSLFRKPEAAEAR